MASRGVVRKWSDDEGWGVLDLDETPGGCWAHYSGLEIVGLKLLHVGQSVDVEWEKADQDGFAFRAHRVRLTGAPPYADESRPLPEPDSPTAFGSTLELS